VGLADDGQQKNQMELAFEGKARGEAPCRPPGGTESSTAKRDSESPVEVTQHLMEEVCKADNLKRALRRVKSNKGSAGVDGMTVEELPDYLRKHWSGIRQQLMEGTYKPQPVRRVEIPKRDGGVRKLGIPTVLDRFIQQAVMQVLQDIFEPRFSEHSYGFRPGRSAQQALAKAQGYINEGNQWVVDIDLEKFFDRVNHDMLMGRVAKQVADKRVLKLIRAYLNAGVLEDGLVSPVSEGTPQGGPLSPLLSNIVLDDLDRELERRGHRFVRYADDCNIYVRSERAGQRVMEGIRGFITKKLKLKVNEKKSAVARPRERRFLGFSFQGNYASKIIIAPSSLRSFKNRVRACTRPMSGTSLEQCVEQLAPYIRGWGEYFGHCQTPTVLERLNSWVRRRLRARCWRQWKTGHRRWQQLVRLGTPSSRAAVAAGCPRGPWKTSHHPSVQEGLSDAYFKAIGLPTLQLK
jgi:RNA-directed DNA polymerase